MKLKCKNCENEWDYKGANEWYATCSRCLRKVKVDSQGMAWHGKAGRGAARPGKAGQG